MDDVAALIEKRPLSVLLTAAFVCLSVMVTPGNGSLVIPVTVPVMVTVCAVVLKVVRIIANKVENK
jgi:hypothetical protein